MPERFFENIKKRILPQWKVCFFAAIFASLAAHLYKITNWLPNWDSLVFRYDGQNMLALGRWFLPVVCAPSSFYDLPFVSGALAILFHALGAVVICRMFSVTKNVTAAIIGALVATFPTVSSVMMYNYVADGYAVSFLFACLAAYLVTKEKPCFVGAIVLIALSSGIYQAYITVTVMLLLLSLVLDTFGGKSIKELAIKCAKYLLTGALGMVLYYAVLVMLLKITGTELLDYQGLDGAVAFGGIDIPATLYTIKRSFSSYFFDFSCGISAFSLINCLFFALTVVLYLIDVVKAKMHFTKILMLVLFAVMLPIGASVLAFVNSSVDYHNLMKMGFLVFYLFLILHYEKQSFKSEKLNAAKSWGVLLLSFLLVFTHVIIANVSYHKLNMAYEKSYGVLVKLSDRIEQTEGANECDSILVIGRLENSKEYSAHLPPDMTGTTDGYIIRADDEVVGQSVLCSALNDYCGKDYKFLAGEQKKALLEKENISDMPCWPAKDSVAVEDNVIIIKLSDEE